MIVTLKAIYVNDTKPNGEPLKSKNGDPYWNVVLDTDEGKMSKLFYDEDMIPKWNKGQQVNIEMKTSGNFKNWDFPKVKPGESPYSMQPEYTPPPSHEGAFNTSQKHNPMVPTQQLAKEVFNLKEDKPDWDEIAKGKVRHGVAIAFVERGIALSDNTKNQINEWTSYIMTGK